MRKKHINTICVQNIKHEFALLQVITMFSGVGKKFFRCNAAIFYVFITVKTAWKPLEKNSKNRHSRRQTSYCLINSCKFLNLPVSVNPPLPKSQRWERLVLASFFYTKDVTVFAEIYCLHETKRNTVFLFLRERDRALDRALSCKS